ncbi:hypothetical protein M1615_00825 [Patescibacteria group bacterium]|nr:hypothetical protein [Patescibacteria group bacterium]MCL5010363.1 hypothetical protein [Patescibacteria group bacterium]
MSKEFEPTQQQGIKDTGGVQDTVLPPSLGALKGIGPTTRSALERLQQEHADTGGILAYLLDRYFEGTSARTLAAETGISREPLTKILSQCGASLRTQADGARQIWQDSGYRERQIERLRRNWQDPEYRKRHAEATKELWHDPEFRKRQADGTKQKWQDPEFRKRNAEGLRQNRQDSGFRARQAEKLRQKWQDSGFRARHIEAIRQELSRREQDPEFRKRRAEGLRQELSRRWQDPEYRKRHAERLATISGERWDVGFAQSAWEANIARVLRHVGTEYYRHKRLNLAVPEQMRGMFPTGRTSFNIDFVLKDSNGRVVGYEIMAHPSEDPLGWAKLQLAREQYPDVGIYAITQRIYRKLQRQFEERINSDPKLAGWETEKQNLKTNPEIFGLAPEENE